MEIIGTIITVYGAIGQELGAAAQHFLWWAEYHIDRKLGVK